MQGLTGLASGVDTAAIVDRLMSIERRGKTRLQLQERRLLASDTALKDIQVKMRNLRAAATALRDVPLWSDTQTVSSSTSSVATAIRQGGTGPGSYVLAVTRLASSEQRTFAYTPSASESSLTVGDKSVAVAAAATLDDVVASINGTTGIGVYATNVDGRLVLSSRTTGTAGAFTASGAAIEEDATRRRAPVDAEYSVDGGATQTSTSNTITGAIAGLQLTLASAGTTTVNVGNPGVDTARVKEKVKAFVEAYNNVVTVVRNKTSERSVRDPGTMSEAERGTLFADAGLTSLLAKMRIEVGDLASLGISTGASTGAAAGADAKAGKLVLDEARLDAAVAAGVPAVRAGLERMAGSLDTLLGGQLDSEGAFDARLKSSEKELTRLRGEMSRWDLRLAEKEKRLKAQFASMETALGLAQSQQAWLTSQLNALNG